MSRYLKCHPSYQEDVLIAQAIEDANAFYALTDTNLYFRNLCACHPEFVQLSSNVYHYKDYYIQSGKRILMAVHSQCLMNFADLELSCLPQGIALV